MPKQIWNTVKELLNEHDCVIIPGFGGFVGNREPARIDQISHIITPPAKRIVFNQNLKNNDGLLANKLAQKLALTYSESLEQINLLVESTKALLQDKKHLDIELFGSFRLNADANYVFLPEKQNNYHPASYGLVPMLAEPVSTRTARVGKTRIFKDRREVKKTKTKKRTHWGLKAITYTLVLLLGVNTWIFLQDNQLKDLKLGYDEMNLTSWFDSLFRKQPGTVSSSSESIQQTSQNVPATIEENPVADSLIEEGSFDLSAFAENLSASAAVWDAPDARTSNNAAIESDTHVNSSESKEPVAIPEPETGTDNEPVKKLPENKLAGRSASPDSVFFVIGGVFCKERNAKRFFDQLKNKGYTPELLVNNNINCKRVSYARFKVRKEAEMFLINIKTSENPGAWILSQHK